MNQDPFPFQDPSLPLQERVQDLVSRMTLEEKIAQTLYDAPAIPRLGVPAYNWWNECLHGVARAGLATVYPQAIGLAATWDVDLDISSATEQLLDAMIANRPVVLPPGAAVRRHPHPPKLLPDCRPGQAPVLPQRP